MSLSHIEIRDLKPNEERFFDLRTTLIAEVPLAEAYLLSTDERQKRLLSVQRLGEQQYYIYRPPMPWYMRDFQQVADVQRVLEFTIRHNGEEYDFSQEWKKDATEVEFEEQKIEGNTTRDYYIVRGQHKGPDIRLYVVNARPEHDGESSSIEDDGVRWADDDTEVESLFLDCYMDAIRDDIWDGFNHR